MEGNEMVKSGSIDDNRGMNTLKHGSHSEIIKGLQKRLQMTPLDDVKKLEFDTMLEQMQSTSWAFDFDRAIKSHLIEGIQDTDKKLMSYMADLQNTQMRVAKTSKDMAFHQKVLEDLKLEYLNAEEGDKALVYEKIQEVEKTLSSFERSISTYIELRNKIRKEIDKGKYQDKSLKLKEESLAGTGAVPIDVDYEVL